MHLNSCHLIFVFLYLHQVFHIHIYFNYKVVNLSTLFMYDVQYVAITNGWSIRYQYLQTKCVIFLCWIVFFHIVFKDLSKDIWSIFNWSLKTNILVSLYRSKCSKNLSNVRFEWLPILLRNVTISMIFLLKKLFILWIISFFHKWLNLFIYA